MRSGLQYGVDYITYSDHMSRVHAEFGVLVLSLQRDARLPWQDLEIVNRLSHQVGQLLLLLLLPAACTVFQARVLTKACLHAKRTLSVCSLSVQRRAAYEG